jgi:hypothetical protein
MRCWRRHLQATLSAPQKCLDRGGLVRTPAAVPGLPGKKKLRVENHPRLVGPNKMPPGRSVFFSRTMRSELQTQILRVQSDPSSGSLVLRESWPAPGRRPFVVPQERGRYQWMGRSSCTSMKPSERGMSTEARTLWPKVDLGSETRRKRLGGGVGGARSKAVPT